MSLGRPRSLHGALLAEELAGDDLERLAHYGEMAELLRGAR